MAQGFTEKEILIELMKETKVQSHILTTLVVDSKAIKEQTASLGAQVIDLTKRTTHLEVRQENLAVKVAAGVTMLAIAVSAVINRFL